MSTSTFQPIPNTTRVARLLSKHAPKDNNNAFITHLDRSPVSTKMAAFAPTFVLNGIFTAIIIWRVLSGSYRYLPILGEMSPIPIFRPRPQETSYIWATVNFTIDYFLFKKLCPIIYKYITGHLWLRLRWGFRPTEIVFRKPTGWRRLLHNNIQSAEQRSLDWTNTLYRAIDPNLINNNPGYNTRSDFWVLEYEATCDAYGLLKSGEVDEKIWELSVWQLEAGQWHVWEVWRVHDNSQFTKGLDLFKAKLEALGKADLFGRWQELIFKATAPLAGSTTPRSLTAETNQAVQVFFAEEGVDFAGIWQEISQEMGQGGEPLAAAT